jgi:hypothetical protein
MMPPRNDHSFPRRENRIPMEIPVVLDGHRQLPGAESTFTENVSAKGARVVSVRRWDKDSRPVSFVLQLEWPTVNQSVATAT